MTCISLDGSNDLRVSVVQHHLSNLSAISWREQVNFFPQVSFQRDDDVRFVRDQHA
jgi:hypothetical protein